MGGMKRARAKRSDGGSGLGEDEVGEAGEVGGGGGGIVEAEGGLVGGRLEGGQGGAGEVVGVGVGGEFRGEGIEAFLGVVEFGVEGVQQDGRSPGGGFDGDGGVVGDDDGGGGQEVVGGGKGQGDGIGEVQVFHAGMRLDDEGEVGGDALEGVEELRDVVAPGAAEGGDVEGEGRVKEVFVGGAQAGQGGIAVVGGVEEAREGADGKVVRAASETGGEPRGDGGGGGDDKVVAVVHFHGAGNGAVEGGLEGVEAEFLEGGGGVPDLDGAEAGVGEESEDGLVGVGDAGFGEGHLDHLAEGKEEGAQDMARIVLFDAAGEEDADAAVGAQGIGEAEEVDGWGVGLAGEEEDASFFAERGEGEADEGPDGAEEEVMGVDGNEEEPLGDGEAGRKTGFH